MDLDTFLENDIREFLDNELEKQNIERKPGMEQTGIFHSVTDFRTETQSALDRGDVHRARILFEQAKQAYDTSSGTAREELGNVLKDLQAKAAAHYAHMQSTQNLFKELENLTEGNGQNMQVSLFAPIALSQETMPSRQTIEAMPGPSFPPSVSATIIPISTPEARPPPTIRTKEIRIIKDDQEAQRLRVVTSKQETRLKALEEQVRHETANTAPHAQTTELIKTPRRATIRQQSPTLPSENTSETHIRAIIAAVREGHIKMAMRAYQDAKHLYGTLPQDAQKNKRAALTEAYALIKEHIGARTVQPAPKQKPIQQLPEQPRSRTTAQHDIHERIETIRKAVVRGDVQTAEEMFLELHQALAQTTSKPVKDILARIRHEIAILKHVRTQDRGPDENALYMKGVFYLVSGKRDLAVTQFREILNANPNHFAARARLQQALAG